MFFIITSLILITGLLLLRKRKTIAGYIVLTIGWTIAIVVTALTSNQWDAGFITFFIALLFMWLVQKKMPLEKQPKSKN